LTSIKPPLLLGHRGGRHSAPENTLAAFDLALACGCDGFEFDVRLSSDKRAVICHDPELKGIEIRSATYERLAAALSGESRLCCLGELIARYAGRAFLDIELKVAGLAAQLAQMLYGVDRRHIVVSSFLPEALDELRRADASIPLGFIFDHRRGLQQWRELRCEFVVPYCALVDEQLVREIHDCGKQLLTWTVNRASEMRRFAALGVDGIVSDDPELLCRTLGGKTGHLTRSNAHS
jgi:glycerophosphoryl diester phosphodiesterase